MIEHTKTVANERNVCYNHSPLKPRLTILVKHYTAKQNVFYSTKVELFMPGYMLATCLRALFSTTVTVFQQ